MEGLGLAADTRELLMPRQRDPNAEDGTIVTASAPTSPAPLHRRPRTDQRVLSAAPEAPPLTEMHLDRFAQLVDEDSDEQLFAPVTDGSPAANGRMARLSNRAAAARQG